MPQFFVDKKFDVGVKVEIRGGDAKHISSVLRLKENDWIVLSDGLGHSFRAIIESSTSSCVNVTVTEKVIRREDKSSPALALAIIKSDRFEWAIEKAVEIGCCRIIPFCSERTVQKFVTSTNVKKIERWKKIALASAIQSGLPFKPQIDSPCAFSDFIKSSGEFGRTVLFYEGEQNTHIRALWKTEFSSKNNLLIIGPEGGFTDDEISDAKKSGFVTVSLGSQILRVETAAITALTIWQYELGNMD